jgi:LysR family transcriptional regulator, nitrogen assimilation regulatory protein
MADFKRLGYFVQIAELGSLTRAAERLRIAQPSLSRQMRLLEEELGVTLFTRGHRGMQLTEAGEALRAQISGPLRHIGHALYEIRSLPTETTGTVIFGMPPTVASVLGEALISRVAASASRISLQIVEAQSGHLLEWMKRGDLDAAILYGPTPAGLNATRLLDDDVVLVAGRTSPFASAESLDLKILADVPLVLPSDPHGLRIAIETTAAKARVRLTIAAQVDSLALTKRLASSGAAQALLPRVAVQDELDQGTLVAIPIVPVLERQLFVAMQSSAESPRAILQVEQIVRNEVAALVTSGAWPSARLYAVGDS